jgi:DNA-binding transcriptional MerR regulator
MRSGHLAGLTGVSTDTLRHYQRLGLLPAPTRSSGNYRDYPPSSSARVQRIQGALKIGFSLDELTSILGARDRGGRPCRHVRRKLTAKTWDIELRIKNLVLMRAELGRISKDWDRRLSRARRGQPAGLLENLPVELVSTSRRLRPRSGNKGA